jgi:alcohol dehydrogenase
MAERCLREARGESYVFGLDVLGRIGPLVSSVGKRATVVVEASQHLEDFLVGLYKSLEAAGVELAGEPVKGAAPNAPREDVYRVRGDIARAGADVVVVVGGGSTIDAAKAANFLSVTEDYSSDIESYFGTGLVTKALAATGRSPRPLVAVQVSASSGAHLTKYSNITDLATSQKKLIVDESIVPTKALFDYSVTRTMPPSVTVDGILDAMSHCLEVFYGATSPADFARKRELCEGAFDLVMNQGRRAIEDPSDLEARQANGLATDLGGLAIMAGGTSGPHLVSFSLIDILAHGRACGLLNPYFAVFFAPKVQEQLRVVGAILSRNGFADYGVVELGGRELGEQVAAGMLLFLESLGCTTRLSEVPGFQDSHIERILAGAKSPELAMKLENMPVPLDAGGVDRYLRPIIEAAVTGDLGQIKTWEEE